MCWQLSTGERRSAKPCRPDLLLTWLLCKDGSVIESFGDEATRDIFLARDTKDARSIPSRIWPTARRKLAMIDAMASLQDLRVPPGNRLEQLKRDRAGLWSIRVNDQYRITFRFQAGDAHEVTCEDYH